MMSAGFVRGSAVRIPALLVVLDACSPKRFGLCDAFPIADDHSAPA